MKKLITIIILTGLVAGCGSQHGGINPPFGLKWGMTFDDVEKTILEDVITLSNLSVPVHEYSKCENLTRGCTGGFLY